MKHLKLFESFKEEDIDAICKEYGVKNYTINEDGSIDVDGDVDMSNIDFEGCDGFPLNFRNISGDFISHRNSTTSRARLYTISKLTSLSGGPKHVGGNFSCSYNGLTSLEGCPISVSNGFYCCDNRLTSLESCPESVGGNFNCIHNQLTSLEGCPKSVSGHFYCDNNKIVTFEHLPFSLGGEFYCADNPICEIWDLFEDYSKIEFLNDCDAVREPETVYKEPIIILERLNFFLEEIGEKPVTEVKGYKCI